MVMRQSFFERIISLMKSYGLPRNLDIEYPDLLDIANYGLKTSTGQIKSKCGDFRGSTRTKRRNRNRRLWKKRIRQINKHTLYLDIQYLDHDEFI